MESQVGLGVDEAAAQRQATAARVKAHREKLAQEKTAAKAVNAKSSEMAQREKKKANRRRAGAGISKALLKRICEEARGNVKLQVARFMQESEMPALIGRPRTVSDKSSSDFGDHLMRTIVILKSLNLPIQNLSELGLKHAIALISYWKGLGYKAGTIQNKLSAIRKFFWLVGKDGLLPKATDLYAVLVEKGIDHDGLRRTQVATVSKAWSQKGVDFEEVLRNTYAVDALVGLQLKLIGRFGLRVNEAVHIQPQASDHTDAMLVLSGAKGGKARSVPYSGDPQLKALQRESIEEAKIAAQMHRRGVLLRPKQTVEEAKKHFYKVMDKVGVTKAKLGVTAHGLRHEYAATLYEEVSGLRPPVEGVHTAQEYEDRLGAVLQAELTVSAALGHARPSISSAYNGSRFQIVGAKMSRDGRMLLNNLVEILEQARVASVFREFDTDMAWLSGAAARGQLTRTEQPIEITVRLKEQGETTSQQQARFEGLDAALSKLIDRKVTLQAWMKKADPDPAVDGFIRVFGW